MNIFLICIILSNFYGLHGLKLNEIQGNPPGEVLASLYENYSAAVNITKPDGFTTCGWSWEYPRFSDRFNFYANGQCYSQNTDINYSCSCHIISESVVTTTLTFLQPIPSGNFDLNVLCESGKSSSLHVIVQNCTNKTTSNGVAVSPSSLAFGEKAHFYCPNGASLYYFNGTKRFDNVTQCLADASWQDQNVVECWKAPYPVNITQFASVTAGQSLTLSCAYMSVHPFGNFSRYFFGEKNYTKPKCENFMIVPTPQDDKKDIYCQAITPYTSVVVDSGKSTNYTLDVQYPPYSVFNNISMSMYLTSINGQYFLRSDENLSMSCLSNSNPHPGCFWTFCSANNSCKNVTSEQESCVFDDIVETFSSVFCTANNTIGITSSSAQFFTVVQQIRTAMINVFGDLQSSFSKESLNISIGKYIGLSCYVDQGNALSTNYMWKFPNNTVVFNAVLHLEVLDVFSTGNYTCFTNDQFGNFSSWIYINTIFAPFQDDGQKMNSSCLWEIGSHQFCHVHFYSNPTAKYLSLEKPNNAGDNDGSNTLLEENGQQVFVFERKNVTNDDFGMYSLNLEYTSSSNPKILSFTIHGGNIDPNNPLELGLVIGLSVAGAVLLFLLAAAIVLIVQRKKSKAKENSAEQASVVFADQQVDVRQNPYEGVELQGLDGTESPESRSGGHQMEDNPLYNPGPVGNGRMNAALQQGPEDPYSVADEPSARLNAHEKIERVNVIYDGTALSGAKGAASPNKNEKKEEIKETEEEKQTRLEGLYAFVDKKAKKNPKENKKPKLKEEDTNNDESTDEAVTDGDILGNINT